MTSNLICIVCPNGCNLSVNTENGIVTVEGASCKKGIEYGKNEITDPRRVLTTSIPVEDGIRKMASVRSTRPIPKNIIKDILQALKGITLEAPVTIGQIVYKDDDNDVVVIATSKVQHV